jgi:hypothetical protein
MGIGLKSVTVAFAYDHFALPQELPDEMFPDVKP